MTSTNLANATYNVSIANVTTNPALISVALNRMVDMVLSSEMAISSHKFLFTGNKLFVIVMVCIILLVTVFVIGYKRIYNISLINKIQQTQKIIESVTIGTDENMKKINDIQKSIERINVLKFIFYIVLIFITMIYYFMKWREIKWTEVIFSQESIIICSTAFLTMKISKTYEKKLMSLISNAKEAIHQLKKSVEKESQKILAELDMQFADKVEEIIIKEEIAKDKSPTSNAIDECKRCLSEFKDLLALEQDTSAQYVYENYLKGYGDLFNDIQQ